MDMEQDEPLLESCIFDETDREIESMIKNISAFNTSGIAIATPAELFN